MAENSTPKIPAPNPALRRLDRLVGTWEMTGRSLDSDTDNFGGRVVISWMPGGFYLEQRGEISAGAMTLQSLEIVGYDPKTDTFPATVYSSMGGTPLPYGWDVQGDTVTHWAETAKYTGTFSADGNTLSGGWRANPGIEQNAGNTYDATMKKVK